MKVLDLGCRTGSAIAAWQTAGDVVVGVDWEDHGQQIVGDFTKEETWDIIDNVTPIWSGPINTPTISFGSLPIVQYSQWRT